MALAKKPGNWILWGAVFVLCLTAFYFFLERPERNLPEQEGGPSATGGTGLPSNPAVRGAASGIGTPAGEVAPATSRAPDAATSGEQVRDSSTAPDGGPGDRGKGETEKEGIGSRIARALGWPDKSSRKGETREGAPAATAPGSPGDASTLLMERAARGERPNPLETLEPVTSASDGDADASGGLENDAGGTDGIGVGRQDAGIETFEIGTPDVVSCSDQPGLCQGFNMGLTLVGAFPGIIGARVGDARAFALVGPQGNGEVWIRSGDQIIRVNTMNLTTEAQLAQAVSDFAL